MPEPVEVGQEVKDPALIAKLEGKDDPHWAQPVTDPELIARLDSQIKKPKADNKGTGSEALKGLGETALSMGTGIAADVAGGLSGIGTFATNAMGLTHDDPASNVRQIQERFTYQPKTESGKSVQGVMGEIGKPISWVKEKLGDWALQDSNSPLVATVYNTMPDVLMMIAGARLPAAAAEAATRGAAKVAEEAASQQVKDVSIRQATRVGYVLPPSEYGGKVGTTLETMAGKPSAEREASIKNQVTTDRLARLDMGFVKGEPLDPATYKMDRLAKAQPYEKARQLPRMQTDQEFLNDLANSGKRYQSIAQDIPDAVVPDIDRERGRYLVESLEPGSALDMMSILRDDASAMFRTGRPEDRAVASVKRDVSNAFEGLLERHATQNGHPEWATEFKEARKSLARSHMYEDATNPATGHVSARKLVAMRAAGDYMDGDALIIADSAGAFSKVFQDVDKQGHYGPFSVIDLFVAIGAMAGHMTHNPAAAVAGGAVLARPAVRGAQLSRPYQKAFAKPNVPRQGRLSKAAQAVGDTPGAKVAGGATGAELGSQDSQQ